MTYRLLVFHMCRYLVIIDDIWEISNWDMIRCALPDNSVEYRIITTTRIFKVAEEIGGPYKLKPLSLENSRILMYARIFGKEDKDKCPDEQLEEVSNRILKKCDGVPLAIITIASLLVSKGRNKLDWYDVCNSIGTGLQKDNTIENMRKVLSLSYYDMPAHLRSCLLYLSMFPEDYNIRKDRLIWLWIAEGFIQPKNEEKGLFGQGENYFNELINRSMIQPMYDTCRSKVVACRVHDMVLDLIYSISSEENFVTIQNNMDESSFASKKVRRISLQNYKAIHGKPKATSSKEHHVRSIFVFRSASDYIPTALQNFSILRVLLLEGCHLSQGYSLKSLGNLIHLRYLGLRDTNIDQLPEEIGNLQFLQMLDVHASRRIPSLPSSIVWLTQLMCLHINKSTRVPEGIRSLIALEELSGLCISIKGKMLEELAHLTELKVLDLEIMTEDFSDLLLLLESDSESDDGIEKSVVECLNKFQKIQNLKISIKNRESNLDGWVINAPENLSTLKLKDYCWFAMLPAWLKVNPSLLVSLSVLEIRVRGLQQEDLEILGRLPALHYLKLCVDHKHQGIIHGRFVVGACSFPCLVRCRLWGFGGPVVFEQGAMPRLVNLRFEFPVKWTREIIGSFDLGLGNLPSLQELSIIFPSGGAREQDLEEAKAAMRHAIKIHPNHPTIWVNNSEKPLVWSSIIANCLLLM